MVIYRRRRRRGAAAHADAAGGRARPATGVGRPRTPPPEPQPLPARSSRRSRGRSWRAGGRCIGRAAAANSSALVSPVGGGGVVHAVRRAQRDGDQPPLRCAAVKTYPWALVGSNSLVGRLASANNPDFSLEEQTLYAELWMGTHSSGPSMVVLERCGAPTLPTTGSSKTRSSGAAPHRLGHARAPRVDGEDGAGRPLLPLQGAVHPHRPLDQAHPAEELAAMLHAKHPDIYKDDNHKPEMALAVAPMEASAPSSVHHPQTCGRAWCSSSSSAPTPSPPSPPPPEGRAAYPVRTHRAASREYGRSRRRRRRPRPPARRPTSGSQRAGATPRSRCRRRCRRWRRQFAAGAEDAAARRRGGRARRATTGGGPAEESERTKHVKLALQLVLAAAQR